MFALASNLKKFKLKKKKNYKKKKKENVHLMWFD